MLLLDILLILILCILVALVHWSGVPWLLKMVMLFICIIILILVVVGLAGHWSPIHGVRG